MGVRYPEGEARLPACAPGRYRVAGTCAGRGGPAVPAGPAGRRNAFGLRLTDVAGRADPGLVAVEWPCTPPAERIFIVGACDV